MLQKLQELVGELYLADTDAKRNRLWQRVHKAMVNLNVPDELAGHILATKDVENPRPKPGGVAQARQKP